MKEDLRIAAVYLDLSRDESFDQSYRDLFRKLALERGARQLEARREKPQSGRRREA
jgi:hypothetical protein